MLDLLDAGRNVTENATDLGVTGQTIYNWRDQHLIDTGRRDGITSTDHFEVILRASPGEMPRAICSCALRTLTTDSA